MGYLKKNIIQLLIEVETLFFLIGTICYILYGNQGSGSICLMVGFKDKVEYF